MNLLQMSLSGAVMILVIIVIRALGINKLPKKTFLVLWGVVVVRLLIPYSFCSAFSVYSLLEQFAPTAETVNGSPAVPLKPMVPANNMTPPPVIPAVDAASVSVNLWIVIWLISALACAVFFAVAYLKCHREFKASLPVDNEYVRLWLNEHRIHRTIEIRQSGKISAPLTYGVFRPVILMPKTTDWDDLDTLKYVLTHEYMHIRRFDAVTKLVLTVALCVHWFNPAVWIMNVLANRDIELSCDEAVIHEFGECTKSAYAMALIRMEEIRSGLTPFCNNFSKNAIEERIRSIMKFKKTSVIGVIFTMTLVLAVTVGFASNPVENIPDEESTTSSAPAPFMYSLSQSPEGELLSFKISIDYLEKSLTEHTADGSITEKDAAFYLAAAKTLSQDGVTMEWIFAEDSGLFTDRGSPERPGFNVYYVDGNGNRVYLDLVWMLSTYVLTPNNIAEAGNQEK